MAWRTGPGGGQEEGSPASLWLGVQWAEESACCLTASWLRLDRYCSDHGLVSSSEGGERSLDSSPRRSVHQPAVARAAPGDKCDICTLSPESGTSQWESKHHSKEGDAAGVLVGSRGTTSGRMRGKDLVGVFLGTAGRAFFPTARRGQ